MEIVEYVSKRKETLKKEVAILTDKPRLCIISVGQNNPASESYVKGKIKDADEIGCEAFRVVVDESTSEASLLELIREKNEDPSVSGIIVQLPVPKHIREEAIIETIDPKKDVDGFSPLSRFAPCTPKGIIDYLSDEGFSFKGSNAVILGRSNIVGKPIAKMLLERNANVTVLHSKTSDEDRHFYLSHADLIIVAIGKEGYLDHGYHLKESAWVVDVGINRGEDGKLHGDCLPGLKVAKQTPVPKGVGLLTRIALMENLLEAAK